MTRLHLSITFAFLVVVSMLSARHACASDTVAVENRKAGTADWIIQDANLATRNSNGEVDIEGYASRTSVDIGEDISFFVHTRDTNGFNLKIFRIGWYNSAGAREVVSWNIPGLLFRRCQLPTR